MSSLVQRAQGYADEARAKASAPTAPEPGELGSADERIELNGDGVPVARGSLSFPVGTTEVGIEGGVFEGGERAHANPGREAGTVAWEAPLHGDGWQRHHGVRLTGEWRFSSSGWPARLIVHPASEQNQQWLGSGVSPVSETQQGSYEPVEVELDAQFSPRLTTLVPERFVRRESGSFSDTVTFDVAPESVPWAARYADDGGVEHAPIVADGTVYGPFTHPQEPNDRVPRSAPVAATATVVADRGPGAYEVRADGSPDEAGYYYWVWEIREADQHEAVRDAELLPADYVFVDRFGLVEEGQVVPTSLRWETALVESEIGLDDMRIVDRVTPSLHHGAWLRDESGERIPATLRLTAYQSDARPERTAEVPESVREVGGTTITVDEHGKSVEAKAIPVPFETRGWITVQTCLLEEDQPEDARGYLEEWCDDYGIPEETARVVPPSVATEAQPHAEVGGTIHDTATVEGRVPPGSTLGFTLYLQPEAGEPKFDGQWGRVRDEDGDAVAWTEEELAEMSAEERCRAQPVATTARVDVAGPGQIRSPGVRAESAGVAYWVEDLDTEHPETGERVELHRGECGLENERTVIHERGEAPETEVPEELAETGAGSVLLGGGIAASVALAILGGMLVWAARRTRAEGSAQESDQEAASSHVT